MKVYKINAGDYYDDNNDGFIYGLEDEEAELIEWFKTEEERENCINKNNMVVEE